MPISFPLDATVTVTARANIRQGSPSVKSPVLRRIDVRTELAVQGWCAGDTVSGNEHWWMLGGDAFIWAGACSEPVLAGNARAVTGSQISPASPATASGQAAGPAGSSRLARYGFEAEFAARLEKLLDACAAAGHEFRIGQGVRPPQTQALYYCEWQKRTPQMIDAAAARLADAGAPWLAALLQKLRDVKRIPSWQTDQLPGSGWHQWGEAADCYCYRNGVQVGNGDDPVYKFYADKAQELGLTAGLYFRHRDAGHVQLRPQAGASDLHSWAEIDATMRARFGEKPALTYGTSQVAGTGFVATRARVYNRGAPPVSFLDELVRWGRGAPEEVFDAPDGDDVYASVEAALGPFTDIDHRRAVMLEVLRVLAGFESSWDWTAGRDISNPTSDRPETTEAGAWQVSANSMRFGPELRDLVGRTMGTLDPIAFQDGMKVNHGLAMEYIARLLRRTVRANGPVLRHEIDRWLSRNAVAEFLQLMETESKS